MRINLKTKYLNDDAVLSFGRYADGALAITATAPNGAPLARLTTCLMEYGLTPLPGFVAIKNYSENEGVLDALISEGVVLPSTIEHVEKFARGNDRWEVRWTICELTPAAKEAARAGGWAGG